MSDTPSGTYVIDENYYIVTYNQIAKELYPQLAKGVKCHKCLMNLDEPCPICPVFNKVDGPKTYFDPIREIYETVDAVPMLGVDGQSLHALVFSTTGKREEFARQLPTSESEFNALYEQEYHDHLTGGLSQKGFIRETERIIQESDPEDQFAVLYFNICNFKAINEVFGYEGGDILLRQSYWQIVQSPHPPLALARIMADHFVCLVNQKDLNYDFIAADAIHDWSYSGRTIRVHSRCGILLIDDKTISISGMIDRARLAKKHIIDEYVQPYAIFDDEMRQEYMERAQVLAEFDNAIQNGQIVPFYQPIVNVETGKIASAEVLVRWKHPQKGMIMPGSFLPVLESSGFITKIDRYMLETVHAQLLERWYNGLPIIPVSINLSWMDLYDGAIQELILNLIRTSPLPKNTIHFETTETAFNSLEATCKRFLDDLRAEDCTLLLDDFGAGYSSIGMIQKYDFDILKIDMKFIRQIKTSPKARNIICAVIAMCHEIGVRTVAEGVEEEAEYEFLRLNHCDFIQGYYIAKPLPYDAFCTFLSEKDAEPHQEHSYLDALTVANASPELPSEVIDSDLLELILNNSNRFIQVCDPETLEMYYANLATRNISGNPQMDYHGQKCHKYMLGLDTMCPHCPMRLMGNEIQRELEVDDGKYVFSLKAAYINHKGKRMFLEMGMNITEIKNAERKYDAQIRSILRSVPEEQGIFHLDVTEDRWLSSSGNAKNAQKLQNIESVDMLIRQISLFVPDDAGKELFFETFCRDALLAAFREGREEIMLETLSYYDDLSIRATRMIACLAENPANGHLETILHGLDISKEKNNEQRLEEEIESLKHISEQAIADVKVKLAKADHDRRVDFLTGLRNRLDMFERIQATLQGEAPDIEAMYMLNVDDFKAYNDLYGHIAGDNCLQAVASALRVYGEQNDIVFYRYGGEEILGIGSHSGKTVAQMAQEILKTVENLNLVRSDTPYGKTTVSLGYTTDNSRYEKMIDKADTALYRVKAQGKNRAVSFENPVSDF